MYTDLSLFTADPVMGRDATRLFNFCSAYSTASLQELETLAVAPFNLRGTLEALIETEIANARAGLPAHVVVKCNSLVDTGLIKLLYRASEEGVNVSAVVRGMCALRPGIPGLSSRIRVKSIVGRFLEHSRIVTFANGHAIPSPDNKVFISSADWMTRNLVRYFFLPCARIFFFLPRLVSGLTPFSHAPLSARRTGAWRPLCRFTTPPCIGRF